MTGPGKAWAKKAKPVPEQSPKLGINTSPQKACAGLPDCERSTRCNIRSFISIFLVDFAVISRRDPIRRLHPTKGLMKCGKRWGRNVGGGPEMSGEGLHLFPLIST